MLFHKRPQFNIDFQLCPSHPRCFVVLSLDRGRVVGGLPDVVTIMEDKVSPARTMAYSRPIFRCFVENVHGWGWEG